MNELRNCLLGSGPVVDWMPGDWQWIRFLPTLGFGIGFGSSSSSSRSTKPSGDVGKPNPTPSHVVPLTAVGKSVHGAARGLHGANSGRSLTNQENHWGRGSFGMRGSIVLPPVPEDEDYAGRRFTPSESPGQADPQGPLLVEQGCLLLGYHDDEPWINECSQPSTPTFEQPLGIAPFLSGWAGFPLP